MPAEKPSYRDVLERLLDTFGGKDVLTMTEVCLYMHCDRRTLLQDGRFPAKKIGGKYVIHAAALARYLS